MSSKKTKKLTAKQEAFINEYLIDLNATQAAIRAGYSKKTANRIATENLSKPVLAAAIAQAKLKRAKRTQIDADWLLKRLSIEAEADIADLYDENNKLRPIRDWPLIWRQGLVSGVKTQMVSDKISVVTIKVSDRVRRLELLGKHISVGAFRDNIGLTGKDGERLIPADTITPEERVVLQQIAQNYTKTLIEG